MKLKGSLTTPTCGRFYGKKLNLVVLSQLVGFFNSLLLRSTDKSFLRWNSKVPPLELKSSKRGTLFGTRMCNLLSTIRTLWRRGALDGDSQIAVSRMASL